MMMMAVNSWRIMVAFSCCCQFYHIFTFILSVFCMAAAIVGSKLIKMEVVMILLMQSTPAIMAAGFGKN